MVSRLRSVILHGIPIQLWGFSNMNSHIVLPWSIKPASLYPNRLPSCFSWNGSSILWLLQAWAVFAPILQTLDLRDSVGWYGNLSSIIVSSWFCCSDFSWCLHVTKPLLLSCSWSGAWLKNSFTFLRPCFLLFITLSICNLPDFRRLTKRVPRLQLPQLRL